MNIWKIIKNDYMDIGDAPPLRSLKIETTEKGFPDIMNYWGTNGAIIVNSKTKTFIERYYGNLSIQFFPCYCSQYPKLNLWIWNACEYHDVLDVDNSVCDKIHNLQGKEVIKSVDKYVFKKEAFDLDFFKIHLGERKYTTYLFVSDRFKKIMEDGIVTDEELKEQSDKIVGILRRMEKKYSPEQLAEIKELLVESSVLYAVYQQYAIQSIK